VSATLRYFDVSILGRRCAAPALFSVAQMDQITPPSSVCWALNNYGLLAGDAPGGSVREYRYNGHDGGGAHHEIVKIDWLADLLEPPR
jgi:cephalosporin-C deacetylase